MSSYRSIFKPCFVVISLLCLISISLAEDYRIGEKDVLRISVWQHPELERAVIVSSEGEISFPPIGRIAVVGLTPFEVSEVISDKLYIYTRDRSHVTVTVTEFNSRRVYVVGQVARPGIYAFEDVPSVWDVILRAGGPTKDASLKKVKVTTYEGKDVIINLEETIEQGQLSRLPSLKPGDTVNVPRKLYSGAAEEMMEFLDESISVIGAVVKPGIYPVSEKGINLAEAMMLAGGPAPQAQLERISIIKGNHLESGSYTILVDYRGYLETGNRSGNPIVNRRDTIFVSGKEKSFTWGKVIGDVRNILQITVTAANLYLLYTRFLR